MKKKLLLFLFTTLISSGALMAQSGHPVTTASITPNPVESKAFLTFEEPMTEGFSLVVKDLTGKTVLQYRPDTRGEECTAVRLDMLESLRRGIYIVQITSDSGKVKTIKFQKT